MGHCLHPAKVCDLAEISRRGHSWSTEYPGHHYLWWNIVCPNVGVQFLPNFP